MNEESKDRWVVHVDASEKRPDLPEYSQAHTCPHCKGITESGFGLAGGGFGIYTYCSSCRMITSKSVIEE